MGRCCQLPGPILSLRGNGQLPRCRLTAAGQAGHPQDSVLAGQRAKGLPHQSRDCPRSAARRGHRAMLPCNARKTAAAVQHGGPRLHRLRQQKSAGPAGGGPHGVPAFAVRLPALQKIAQGGVFFGIRFVFCQPAAQGKQLPLHHAHLGGIVLG